MALKAPGPARGELMRCGMFVPKDPAEVLDVARLLLARPLDELLAASSSVDP